MKRIVVLSLTILLLLPLVSCGQKKSKPLPLAEPDSNDIFGIDKNINMSTIDEYLGRSDVAYIDVRMLFDPANFSDIGGEADLTKTIEGFKIVPYPYIATLNVLPVGGAYDGNCLYTVTWDDNNGIKSVEANYLESDIILSELFPKEKAIFLMCGGGGYAGMMKSLLIYLGWDKAMIYNIGGNWNYKGKYSKELIIYPEDASNSRIYASWRADYAYIEFSKLQRIN